ncbi:MAG: hypothetical protein V3T70_05985 [Phycisphaerae bacterium]
MVGLLLVFRSVSVIRIQLAVLGGLAGGWVGAFAAVRLGTPPPVTVALGAIAGMLLFHSTYRLWLGLLTASMAVLIALAFHWGETDTVHLFAPPAAPVGEFVQLPSAEERTPDVSSSIESYAFGVRDRFRTKIDSLSWRDWRLPALIGIGALIVGWRAPRFVSGVAVGGFGSILAVISGAALVCATRPAYRDALTAQPQWLAGAAAVLWLWGVLAQRHHVVRARRTKAAPPPDRLTERRDRRS